MVIRQILIEIWLFEHEFQNRNFGQFRIFGLCSQNFYLSFAFQTKIQNGKVKFVTFGKKLIQESQNNYQRTKIDQ